MNQESIDRYLAGEMSQQERELFDKQLEEDAALREQVALHRDIVTSLKLKGAKAHLQALEEEIAAEQKATAKQRSRRGWVWGWLTCAVAGCLVLGGFIYHDAKVDAYRSYAMGVSYDYTTVRGGEIVDAQITSAFESGEYEKTLELIEKAEQRAFICDDPHPEQQAQARIEYEIERDHLLWLKTLTLMRQGEWWQARKLLKEIAASESEYREEAQQALNKL